MSSQPMIGSDQDRAAPAEEVPLLAGSVGRAEEPVGAAEAAAASDIVFEYATTEDDSFAVPIEVVPVSRRANAREAETHATGIARWFSNPFHRRQSASPKRRAALDEIQIKRNDLWESDWEVVAVSDCLEWGPRPLELKQPRFLIGRWARRCMRAWKRFIGRSQQKQ